MSEEEVGAGNGEEAGDQSHEDPKAQRVAGEAEGEAVEQTVPVERLNREVGRRKETEDRLAEMERQLSDAQGRVKSLEDQGAANFPLHPRYLKPGEAELINRANELRDEETRLEDNPEGIPGEASLETPEQVRARLRQVRAELRDKDARATAVYERGRTAQLADLDEGYKARTARDRARGKEQGAGSRERGGERPTTSVGGGGGGTPDGGSARPKRGQDEERFKKAGGGLDAAARELAELVPE